MRKMKLLKISVLLAALVFSIIFIYFAYQRSQTMTASAEQIFANIDQPLGGRTIDPNDLDKLVVMEATGDPSYGYYKSYNSDATGLTNALADLYDTDDPSKAYIMYIGKDLSAPAQAVAAGNASGSFSGLNGRVGALVLTGTETDIVTTDPAYTTVSGHTLTAYNNCYFGCDIILRNMNHYLGGEVYMQGFDLTLGGNSWQTYITNYYGGSKDGTITPADGTTKLTVYSTGIYRTTLYGGMNTGTLQGNTSITIHNTSGNEVSLYGGGNGPYSWSTANVTGNIDNTIYNMESSKGGLVSFCGGVHYGTINGRITNRISGNGRIAVHGGGSADGITDGLFAGGSQNGSIGDPNGTVAAIDTSTLEEDYTPLEANDNYAIKNIIDTSNYSFGRFYYVGANTTAGDIFGNIINIVKSGGENGGFSGFQGAGGSATIAPITDRFTAPGNGKIGNVDEGIDAFVKESRFRVYGNITNLLRSGCFSLGGYNGNFRGAGYGGYIKGNVHSIVGSEGLVYRLGYDRYTYRVSKYSGEATQGYFTDFDLVGGGGINGYHICIVGDTTLITKEVLSRWTYGGNFGGAHIGNSALIHKGGIIDTCEGSGRDNRYHVGDSHAEVQGGQVDWFLSGGGWNDIHQDGNVSVTVLDSPIPNVPVIINASMGGTYGETIYHKISGSSTMLIKGGNFSGIPRDGTNGFSAGVQQNGYIFGDAKMTIDLRGNQNGFQLANNDNISGGRGKNTIGESYLGTTEDNSIELNIFADEGTDLLNGLNIYGDACSNVPERTRSGNITININAPGSQIGNLYATNYKNLTTSTPKRIWRNTTINLVSASTINGLSSGNGFSEPELENTLNNTIASYSASQNKFAVINIGPQSDDPNHDLGEWETAPGNGLPRDIQVGGNGINGFTSLNIRKRLLTATAGTIKNGGARVNLSNYNDYSSTGELILHAGTGTEASGLGIGANITGTSTFVAGDLTVVGEGTTYIQSSGIKDQVIINKPTIPDKAIMTWLKVGNTPASIWSNSFSTWFGLNTGWYVFTSRPNGTNANTMTPFNLEGLDEGTREVFIGDNVAQSSDGYAICVAGAIYRWKVTKGEGDILHNIPNVHTDANPPAAGSGIQALGNVDGNTPSKEGRLVIPRDLIPDDFKFTFQPAANGWVQGVQIHKSNEYISNPPPDSVINIPPQSLGSWDWQVPADSRSFSADITAQFDAQFSKTASVNGGTAATGSQDAPIQVYYNDTITYQITGYNTYSDDPAAKTTVTDTIPNGLTIDPASVTNGGAINGQTITWDMSTLPEGSFTLEASATASIPGDFINSANVTPWNGTQYDYSTNQTFHFISEKTTLSVKNEIGNFAAYANNADYLNSIRFPIHLTGDINASINMGHNESSPIMTFETGNTDRAINISEVVPMEFAKEYTVTTLIKHFDGTTETFTDQNITIKPGDEVTITISNTYQPASYFKDRKYMNNNFTAM